MWCHSSQSIIMNSLYLHVSPDLPEPVLCSCPSSPTFGSDSNMTASEPAADRFTEPSLRPAANVTSPPSASRKNTTVKRTGKKKKSCLFGVNWWVFYFLHASCFRTPIKQQFPLLCLTKKKEPSRSTWKRQWDNWRLIFVFVSMTIWLYHHAALSHCAELKLAKFKWLQ